MTKNLTQSAASLSYLGIIYFFALISLLGFVDIYVTPPEMLMNVIPDFILLSALAGFVLLLFLFKWRTPKQLRFIGPLLATIGIVAFVVFQMLVWGWLPAPETTRYANPFTLALTSVMLLMFFLALMLRHNYPRLAIRSDKQTLIVLGGIMLIGVCVWYAMSVRVVELETENARTKINLIGKMIDARFTEQTNALERIKRRVEALNDDESELLLRTDVAAYIKDYDIIQGMLILDEQQNVIISSSFAEAFWQMYMRGSEGIQNWIKETHEDIRIAANGQSLQTATPTVMMAVPIQTSVGERKLIALLNLNGLVAADYLSYLSTINTFMAFNPELLIAMQGQHEGTQTLAELQAVYAHVVHEKVTLVTGIEHDFYSVLVDYSPLHEAVRLHQMLLWLTGAFAFIFILAADTMRRLRRESKKLETMARFDELTGFLRRDAFNQDTLSLMAQCEGCRRAVLFVNLDKFNSINDGLGHQMGDHVLKLCAQRIRNTAQHADMLARFSNDEFIAYYSDTTVADVKKDANATLKSIAEVFAVEELSVHLTASIGIAVTTKAHVSTEQLIQFADIAMDKAKSSGGNQFAIYQRDMQDKHEQLVAIRTALQVAMNDDHLEVFYQPIYDAQSGRIVSVESLVRWRKDGEFISPAVFIPIAEQTGQIVQLGDQVLRKVMHDLNHHEALRRLTVAVNVSPHQLARRSFVEDIMTGIEANHIQPEQLTLELTEAVMSDAGTTEASLRQLRSFGLHVAIDDFGTGFSSLAYLTQQPADIIKIDRAFTLGVEEEGKQRNLLLKMIEMCKQLDKIVVVEGVETLAQVKLFKAIGVDRMQGFYFAKPMPLAELLVLLENEPQNNDLNQEKD